MTFHVTHQPNAGGARSPFHIVETETGREVDWINQFLDRECVRCLAPTTLRAYAMDLLHFVRWWASVNHTDAITENALPSVLPDYVRFQVGQQPRPAPASINRRLTVVCCALQNAFPDADHPTAAPSTSHFCRLHPPLGFGRFRPKRSRFRVNEPNAFPRRSRWIRLPGSGPASVLRVTWPSSA